MDTCLCNTVGRLVKHYDADRARNLIPTLNSHLRDLRSLLARSKPLAREVQYQIILSSPRTTKALVVDSVNLAPVNKVCERFANDLDGFWTHSSDAAHSELRRRLACVVIFLRSKLEAASWMSAQIAYTFQSHQNHLELRNSGRKYLKIARKLGGLGSIFWLPLEIPPSTYERYLNIDDEEVFGHLKSLGLQSAECYSEFVQRLILSQLGDLSASCSYYNLFMDHVDILPASDQLLLMLHALGGSDVPDLLLKGIRFPQRRWNADGEIESINAVEFGLPVELINLLSDDRELSETAAGPYITQHLLENGIIAWSLRPETTEFFSEALRPQTMDVLRSMALKLICFTCPPCYEGNTDWSAALKKAIWPLLERTVKPDKVQAPLRLQVLETFLFFCERDSVPLRHLAVAHAKALLRKSMPYYLQASVVLFRSILDRLDGDLVKSEAQIRDFLRQGQQPTTRRDNALKGRLHISHVENKIKKYDEDVPASMYKWEAAQPLSRLDIEITSRLQGVAARFFLSVGDFPAAKASLEPLLSLYTATSMRINTRRLIAGRLADILCEMQEFSKVIEILQIEFDSISEQYRLRRPFRRLLLASVEANIGLGKLDVAEMALEELRDTLPPELEDLHDQQLYMRSLLAAARIAHIRSDRDEAVLKWKFALQEVERMYALKSKGGFIAAMIYLSLAHAQLTAGDRDGGRYSWSVGLDILTTEKCEYCIPIVPTLWLQKIVREVHALQGWAFRMMLPGGRPDFTWPPIPNDRSPV